MDVQYTVAYPVRSERGCGPEPKPVEIVVDLQIADLRSRPMTAAFAVRPECVLPGIRIHHDARRTLAHDGRYWMAVAEPDSGGLRSGPASDELVREAVARGYVVPALRDCVAASDARQIRVIVAEAASRGAENLAVFADGRLYEADVVPLFEIKNGMTAYVSIVPSSARRLERASYFRPDRCEAAEAFFRRQGGTGPFPAIVACDAVAVPEEAALWSLAEAARDAVERFGDGIDERQRDRWMERICGQAVVEALEAVRRCIAVEEPRLADLIAASNRLVAAARERLLLDQADALTRAIGALEDRSHGAERLMAERAPAMTDPPAARPDHAA